MNMKTDIFLRPGNLSSKEITAALLPFFEKKIISPQKTGSITKTISTPDVDSAIKEVHDYLLKNRSVLIHGKSKKYLSIGKYIGEDFPFSAIWSHYSEAKDINEFKKTEYDDLIGNFFSIIPSSIALCGNSEAEEFYGYRIEKRAVGRERVPNVKTIGDGLAYPRWKTWFGKPYIDLIGKDKIMDAPCLYMKEYKNSILVCLYENPADWNTEKNLSMVDQFKQHLGEDYFFDAANPSRKLKTPF